jgi:hypothetical protein
LEIRVAETPEAIEILASSPKPVPESPMAVETIELSPEPVIEMPEATEVSDLASESEVTESVVSDVSDMMVEDEARLTFEEVVEEESQMAIGELIISEEEIAELTDVVTEMPLEMTLETQSEDREAEAIVAPIESSVTPVVERIEELIVETAPSEEVPAAREVLERIQSVILQDAEVMQALVPEEIGLSQVVPEAEAFSPELEALIVELTEILGDVEPEAVRKLIMQLREELIVESTEEATPWLDEGMHEALPTHFTPKLAFMHSIHSLLGKVAMLRPIAA